MDESLDREHPGVLDGQVAGDGRTLAEYLRDAFSVVKTVARAHKAELLAALLLLLMAANFLSVISRKSITNDEIVHIPAGYYHLVQGFFQLNNEHPPLVKMWAALPLLFVQPDEPPVPKGTPPENFQERTWGYQERFWPDNDARFDSITYWTRVWMLPLTLGLGALIFVYTRKLFGARAAALAVALYAFEPTMLAHGRIVHTDVPAALVYMLFFFALHAYRDAPTLRRAVLVGLAGGVALTTKFSMIVLLPVLGVAALAAIVFAPRLKWRRVRVALHAALAFLIILLFVNAAYYFQHPPLEPYDVLWVKSQSAPTFDRWMTFFRLGSKLVPTYFLFGIYNVVIHNAYGHSASLLGEYSRQGWWYYFPVAFALKTSLPFLLVSVAALLWSLRRLVFKRDARLLVLLVPLAVYALMSMSSHINIGIRHFLPVFPFLFITGGALLDSVLRQASALRQRHLRAAATALILLFSVGWMAFEAARAYPDYIPYMNELASSRPHWYYLSDSNVEWGDDAGALAAYLHARGETTIRGAISGGWGTLRHYRIGYAEIFPKPGVTLPDTRYVAIGASFLNGSVIALPADENGKLPSEHERVNYLDRYRHLTPEAVFGHSIYLYRAKPDAEPESPPDVPLGHNDAPK